MINAELLPSVVLQCKAVVYVRQSTQAQVQMNLESQRRQYDLVGEARRLGFRDIEVIDDDLGRSATGTVARPGFAPEKLVLFYVWTHPGLQGMDATGIICWSFVVWLRRG